MYRDTELPGQRLNGGGTLGDTADHGAAVRFGKQHLVRREACGVRRQIHVETESYFLVWTTHRNFGESHTQTPLRAVMGGPKQTAPRAPAKPGTAAPFRIEIHTR